MNTCPICNASQFYNAEYDSCFCAECNSWTEKACSDPECEYCSKRPEKPLSQ